jgi:LytR cell envelope-related transcriptional attenuator
VSTQENTTHSSRADWVRPVVLAVSCLVLGFVAGWALRGGDDGAIIIPAAPEATITAESPPPAAATTETTGTTATTATTDTAPPAVTVPDPAPPPPPALPEASAVTVAVLNGSGVTGLAGETATKLEGVGYTGVTPGNTAGQIGPTIVYYRPGEELAARKVAQDLGFGAAAVRPLTDAVPVTEAPAAAQVIVVLGPG